jgi:hypothetical protein
MLDIGRAGLDQIGSLILEPLDGIPARTHVILTGAVLEELRFEEVIHDVPLN